jgi:hypothetical protein
MTDTNWLTRLPAWRLAALVLKGRRYRYAETGRAAAAELDRRHRSYHALSCDDAREAHVARWASERRPSA